MIHVSTFPLSYYVERMEAGAPFAFSRWGDGEFLAALETATVWTIQDGMLDMHRTDGERVLTANPVAR